MKIKNIVPLFFILCALVLAANEQFNVNDFVDGLMTENNWEFIEGMIESGPMENYFDYDTVMKIYNRTAELLPQIMEPPFVIGKSYLENNMYAAALSIKKGDLEKEQGILIDSLHHAREVLSLQMQLYLFAKIVSDYTNKDEKTLHLLSTTVIWFIPAVNVDGYKEVMKVIHNTSERLNIRKNFNKKDCPNQRKGGIDLNRNYDEHFGIDEVGSSGMPCDEIYRGKEPFSEPETRAIRDFVNARPHIKVAFNLHSFGNMWIRPVNYLNDQNNSLLKAMFKQYNIYSEFDKEAKFSDDALKGNSVIALKNIDPNYTANGEATDWMLLQKKIIAFSPEIGVEKGNFFPDKIHILTSLQENSPPIEYMMHKVMFEPRLGSFSPVNKKSLQSIISNQKITVDKKEKKQYQFMTLDIFNRGIGDLDQKDQIDSIIDFSIVKSNQQAQSFSESVEMERIFFLNYDEDLKEEKERSIGLEKLGEFLSKFKLSESEIIKQDNNTDIIQTQLKGKSYQVKFNTSFPGRSFRRYYIMISHGVIRVKESVQINLKISVKFGKYEKQFLLADKVDFDIPNENSNIDEEDLDEIDSLDSHNNFVEILGAVVVALLLMYFITRAYRRWRQRKTMQFIEEMTNNNELEIN